ncbi:hypothetical protein K3495_g8312 [Podosphaera aphanis]|nr:hypothetical protein K3495_g8312 [Podosphaera aphanis]
MFTGLEKDVIKRQDQYLSWKSQMNLNFVQDEAHFDNEKVKILTILRCLGGDAYHLNRDIIEQVQQKKDDPSAWDVKTSDDLLNRLVRHYETVDLAHDAALKFDLLSQGNQLFQNFLSSFMQLAKKSNKTEEQMVDALKKKVSPEITNERKACD